MRATDTILDQLKLSVLPYGEAQARKAGELRVSTKHLGLSWVIGPVWRWPMPRN